MEDGMAKYITLFRYRSSIEGGGPERFAEAQQIMAEEGGRILQVYGLLGAYDILAVTEGSDNRSAMKAAAKVGNLINASTHTMPAIERDDFLQLLTEL
jgi:uncharacterized protein with GYD domain